MDWYDPDNRAKLLVGTLVPPFFIFLAAILLESEKVAWIGCLFLVPVIAAGCWTLSGYDTESYSQRDARIERKRKAKEERIRNNGL